MKRLLPVAGVVALLTVIFGTIYGTVQQSQRLGANDPQIQIAEDTEAALNRGSSPKAVVHGRVDLTDSLSTFVIVYGKNGKPVAGSGYLNNKLPTIPLGVLTASQDKDYNFVTWQPQENVRIAAVTSSAHDYYVLSGRSLKEVEKREARSMLLATLGWLTSLGVVLVVLLVVDRLTFKT